MSDNKTHYCWECKLVEIPEPEYCCGGHILSTDYYCGCLGLPIDPPYCEECWRKMVDERKR